MKKKAKIVIAQPGGGTKTELRTGNGQGWLVLTFDYDEEGKRTKADEKRSAADGYVLQLMRQDPEFWEKFLRLAAHPTVVRALADAGIEP